MKKSSKKVLTFALALLSLVSPLSSSFTYSTPITTITTYAASKKVKLNYTTKKLYIGKSFTLKLKGAKVKKWSSSDTKIATVSKKGKVKGKKKGTVTIKCKAKNGKTYKCKVTVRYNVKQECSDMSSWLTDMWNDGFCDLSWYEYQGTDACGREMDVDYTLHKLKKHYKKYSHYNKFIKSLKGSKYDELKYIWERLSPKMQELYDFSMEYDWSKCPKKSKNCVYGDYLDQYEIYETDMKNELYNFY